MKTITVNVTQEDIARGVPGKPCSCPIALAAGRSLGCPAMVGKKRINVGYDELANLPEEARLFIERFDYGFAVQPFSFTLEVPS